MTYIDCYGLKRDSSTHQAIFEISEEMTRKYCAFIFSLDYSLTVLQLEVPLMQSALQRCEPFRYYVPGLPRPQSGIDNNGLPIPVAFIILLPNMYEIPDLSKDSKFVYVREDGRFALGDFTLSPQWLFVSTDYLPYIRRKPKTSLDTHPFGEIWYNLTPRDFVYEKGSTDSKIGQISTKFSDKFLLLCNSLRKKVDKLLLENHFERLEITNLCYSTESMHFAAIILQCAPQTFQMTLLTVTGFQRHYLEVLACYDYLTIYRMKAPSSEPVVDTTLMGTITFLLESAQSLFSKGIPVWLVRPPQEFSPSTHIFMSVCPRNPDRIIKSAMVNLCPIYRGDASALRNRACQALKIGNVQHGHTSNTLLPGDFNIQHGPGGKFSNFFPYHRKLTLISSSNCLSGCLSSYPS